MRKKIRLVGLIVFMSFFSSGCAHQIIMKAIFPSYDETVAAWPKLREDYGRVLFYYKNLAEGIILEGDRITIHLDDYQCSLEHGQFIYDDLPEGNHTFRHARYNKKPTLNGLTLNIRAGEITYVEISYKSNSTSGSDSAKDLNMQIVDEKTALNTIATRPQYTHAYENIQSCLAQQLNRF